MIGRYSLKDVGKLILKPCQWQEILHVSIRLIYVLLPLLSKNNWEKIRLCLLESDVIMLILVNWLYELEKKRNFKKFLLIFFWSKKYLKRKFTLKIICIKPFFVEKKK